MIQVCLSCSDCSQGDKYSRPVYADHLALAQSTGMPAAVFDSAEKLAHPPPETVKNYDGRLRYCNSKLCNVLWMYVLNRHMRADSTSGKQWTVTAFDPGLMPGTGLARDAGPVLQFIWHSILPRLMWLLRALVSPNVHTAVESGSALARLAVGTDTQGKTGVYFEGLKEIKSSVDSQKVEKQDDLYDWTLKTVAKDDAERQSFAQI